MAETQKTVKAVVLADVYAYHETPGDPESPRVEVEPPEGTSSARGVEVEVPAAEFERAQKMKPSPTLAKAGSKEAKAALAEPPSESYLALANLSDDELAALVKKRGGDPAGLDRSEQEAYVIANPSG